jgi:cell division protein FtsB
LKRAREFARDNWARLAATAILLGVFFGNSGFRALVGNWWQLRRLKTELAALEKEEVMHAERLKLVRAGDRALERMARRELGYVRKGEIEYRFPPPEK